MIKGNYAKNLNALEEIFKLANNNDIDLYVYIAPLRNDVKFHIVLRNMKILN